MDSKIDWGGSDVRRALIHSSSRALSILAACPRKQCDLLDRISKQLDRRRSWRCHIIGRSKARLDHTGQGWGYRYDLTHSFIKIHTSKKKKGGIGLRTSIFVHESTVRSVNNKTQSRDPIPLVVVPIRYAIYSLSFTANAMLKGGRDRSASSPLLPLHP